jgi:rod shape determining protein RodA
MASLALPRRVAVPIARRVDVVLIASSTVLAALGTLMVYSATRTRLRDAGLDPTTFLTRQVVWATLGLGVMVVASLVDYRALRDLAPIGYGVMVVVLLAVLTPLGSTARGTQAWFPIGSFQLQPSEFAKLGVIIAVAAYGHAHRGDIDAWRLAVVLVLAAVPLGLVLLQPDFGTALVVLVVLIVVLLVAGARARHLAVLALFGITAAAAMVHAGTLKQYQVDRLTAFLDQSNDAQRTTYNLNQSKIAIANGRVIGRGLFHGTQTNLSYVPEQHTDFIFTVVGEELGFVGAATLLALFAIVVWRTWRAARAARDLFGALVCAGVLAMLTFQVFENVGMTMGIMPITGILLPFVSYGGSSMLTSFAGVGLVVNIGRRRFP